ncbi:MAG: ATP-binding cassette domain-containing protein [Candidatus Margulisbacteria bacterium]|nr:ATP-binding cassette domain-containing protein [Candidatus Margulisiibacteriota bacterium]
MIMVKDVSKGFKIPLKKEGLYGAIQGLFTRRYIVKEAIKSVSFNIQPGEMVGLIGPNGAGKSTLIKMLCGILVPDTGEIEILGLVPYKHRKKYTRNIGVVFGQRSQLWWDLPVGESYTLLKKIYRVDTPTFNKRLEEFSELLEIKDLLRQPVRTLSLGEKMRCELIASLLHNPPLLFLDEPTIGLDIIAKIKIRGFIKEWNRKSGSTVILTTHDLSDIQDICKRVIIIDEGNILFDTEIDSVIKRFSNFRRLLVNFSEDNVNEQKVYQSFSRDEKISIEELEVANDGNGSYLVKFSQDNNSIISLIDNVLANFSVSDIKIQEPSIETVIRLIYEKKVVL